MPFSAAASALLPAVRGALLSRTAASAANAIAFRHMSAGPGFDYVKVNSRRNLNIFTFGFNFVQFQIFS